MWSVAARTVNALTPGALAGVLRAGRVVASFTDPDLQSKLRLFELFERSRSRPEIPSADRVARLAARRDLDALWEMEGLGYRWGVAVLRREPTDLRLLRSPDVPERALLPLHTGAGMAFAAATLDGASGSMVERFLDRCAESARPGWEGAMHETLGFVARTLRPELLESLDGRLKARGRPLPARLWHGVGRSVYFLPSNHLPWLDARTAAVLKAVREPPRDEARIDAAAGLAWAVALVHAPEPETVERFVREAARDLPIAALGHGVAAAEALWRGWAGAGPVARPTPEPRGAPRRRLAATLAGREGRPDDLFHVSGGP